MSSGCGCGQKNCKCTAKNCPCTPGNCACSGKDCGCDSKKCTCTTQNDSKSCGCKSNSCSCAIKTITADELHKKMASDSSIIVINALSEDYFNKCHIKGSINVPLDQLPGVAGESWNKNDNIVVYCASYECPVSKNAYNMLKKLGFTNVCAYEGGTQEWCQKGYPVVGECFD